MQLREAQFNTLFENVPDAMVIIDAETGKFVDANAKALRLFGLERDELIGIGPLDISPPVQPDGRASEEVVHEKIQELLSEHPKPFEWVHKHASGRDILCEIRHAKLPIPERKLYCAMAIDITERRRAENEITQYKHIIESSNNPIGLVDRSYIYQYVNEPYCQALNKPIRDIIGHSVPELFGRNFFETVMEHHYKRCFAGEIVDYQAWFDFPGWGRRYMDVRYYPFRAADGRITATVVNVHDITERKRAEEALSEHYEFERLIADIAAQLVQTGAEQLKKTIDSTLQALGRFLHTERSFFAQFSEGGNRLVITNTWVAEGYSPLSRIFKMEMVSEIPWVAELIRSGGVINAGPGLTGLPDEAQKLRTQLERDGINSGVVVPVCVEGRSIGMLGLDTIDQPREYPQSIVDRLMIVADMIGATLQRVWAQEVLHEQLQFEDLISNLSATFIHIKASDIDKNIERGLQLIVEFLDIERGNLFRFSRDQERLNLTHSFARNGVKHSPRILISDHQPWFTKKLLSRESFCFSHPTELPEKAQAEKEYLMQQGIISALIIPLEAAGVVHGGITLSSLRRERHWSEKLIQQFTFLSEVFSNALLRKRADEKIGEALTEIKQLKDRLEQENIYLREEVEVNYKHEEIVGKSKPVMEMLSRAEQVAETDATVLILGETGTGKELLAHELHRFSRRKNRPMVNVNCAALPATLIESELFGREKGAYTGATSRQVGRFEIADGSTLFLDEIGELPLRLQSKLLRLVQEGQFERLGNPKTITVDVRIFASTNRDLSKAVEEGRFREDLYYRLNVFPITVPPLRERPEDIPMLIWSFVKEFEKSMGKTVHNIPKKSFAALQHYNWPGNIRELKNVVESAMIISQDKILKITPPVDRPTNVQKNLKLEDVERNHIREVLKKASWRVSGKNGAAELLGLKPTTLESRMKKLGIKRPK